MAASETAEHLGLRTTSAFVAGTAIIQTSKRKGCAKQEHSVTERAAVAQNHTQF